VHIINDVIHACKTFLDLNGIENIVGFGIPFFSALVRGTRNKTPAQVIP
jgi:hypothetical protein